jgi:aryl-alcohol dehydrogenase-like predicted oxidoreductase
LKAALCGQPNFQPTGTEDMEELAALPGGSNGQTNQMPYNLTRRGIEFDLIPWCAERKMPVKAPRAPNA